MGEEIVTDADVKEFMSLNDDDLTQHTNINLQLCYFPSGVNNMSKNRYNNVFPTERSRVTLSDNGYFNGNYVIMGKHRYIATQAPVPSHTPHGNYSDFVDVIIGNKITAVIMLSDFVDEQGVERVSNYLIDPAFEVVDKEEYAFFTVRTVRVKKIALNSSDDKDTYEFKHYHFLSWKDHYSVSIKRFIYFVSLVDITVGDGTLLVHCSAGLGRTGTFIVGREIIANANCGNYSTEGEQQQGYTPTVKTLVTLLRSQRAGSVTTFSQYFWLKKLWSMYGK